MFVPGCSYQGVEKQSVRNRVLHTKECGTTSTTVGLQPHQLNLQRWNPNCCGIGAFRIRPSHHDIGTQHRFRKFLFTIQQIVVVVDGCTVCVATATAIINVFQKRTIKGPTSKGPYVHETGHTHTEVKIYPSSDRQMTPDSWWCSPSTKQ